MRILIAIPHFFQRNPSAQYGSEKGDLRTRGDAVLNCISTLKQNFGHEQAFMGNLKHRCNSNVSTDVDIVVCTTQDAHNLGHIPSRLFSHKHTQAAPRFLGYECHAVLAEAIDKYDYFCFMEDDLLITDSMFFWKIKWFSDVAGQRAVLQPHRFETSVSPPIRKLYIDGPLKDRRLSARFQDQSVRPRAVASVLDREVTFERVDNPHAGFFCLNREQMKLWISRPYFLDRSSDFVGPLESAATLGLMRTFEVYKPAVANAAFLEIHHLDRRYLDARLQVPPNHKLLG